jgi:stage III sporulation protein AG
MNDKNEKIQVIKKENKGIFAKIKSIKNIEIIFVAILGVIVILIMLSSFNFTDNNTSDEFSTEEYVTQLEKKLSTILSTVESAGKVSVMITVESGMETVTAVETTVTQTGNETKTTTSPILVGGKVVILKELYPKITGVLIVAEGADSIKVKLELLKATSSVLSIDEKIVEIFTMK